eukprot:5631647-Amphidinium_carterae.1
MALKFNRDVRQGASAGSSLPRSIDSIPFYILLLKGARSLCWALHRWVKPAEDWRKPTLGSIEEDICVKSSGRASHW